MDLAKVSSKCDSSGSRDCRAAGSRKRGRCSQDSLESNLGTPKKRLILAKPTVQKKVKRAKRSGVVLENQPVIDQYFLEIQEEPLQTTKDTLSTSENSPKTPVKSTENIILPGKDSCNDKSTSKSNCSTALSENSKDISVSKIISLLSDEEDVIENPSDERLSDKESHHATDVGHIQTDKVNASPRYNNKFISNSKSGKENQGYSFCKSRINVEPLQEIISNISPTVLNEEKSYQKTVQGFCSDSSSNSNDPEEIVSLVNTKVEMPDDYMSVELSASPHIKRKSFLASLSNDVPFENAHPKAVRYRANYSFLRDELGKELYALYNEKVFDNQLPKAMLMEWNVRLRATAGEFKYSTSLEKTPSSRILLSTKILDSPNRLRDVLIHEMCHAATRLIDCVRDGHGSVWKAWASKAAEVFPELPAVTKCYSYQTEKKFTYRCTRCGHSFGRHRRSLDINKKVCVYCQGPFEILINK